MNKQQNTTQRLGIFLAILGIAGVFLYGFYVIFWSGERIAQIELEPEGRSSELAVALDPEMNPVRAVLRVEYSGWRGRRVASYDIAIGGDDDVRIKDIFNESGIASDSSEESGPSSRTRGLSINLGTFDVPQAAGYLVRSDISPSLRMDVETARITLTANSAEWDFRIVGALAVALVLGYAMGIAGRNKEQENS
ncbi:MAG: hypothetical protein ABR504_11880 [Paracoccaceae bacterium]